VTLPTYDTLLVERDEPITVVAFNRPEKRNALSPRLHREMYDLLSRLEGDDATRVLVVTGVGPAFCAGQDMREFFHDLDGQEAEQRRVSSLAYLWRDQLLRMFPRPTIAMVNGYCFGAGTSVVCACDLAIAAEDARFGIPAVNFGGIPGGLVAKTLADALLPRDALYYGLTGETFDGRQAAAMKFVTRAVPAARLREETFQLARKLATLDPAALRATKEALRVARDLDHEQAYYWQETKTNELRWRQEHAGLTPRHPEDDLTAPR
jgi:trans-feruloyl-CoA hydratase/vanillin synthase